MSSLWCICASIVYIKNLFGQCNKIARVPLTSRAESALVINMSLFRVVFHSIICFLSPKRLFADIKQHYSIVRQRLLFFALA